MELSVSRCGEVCVVGVRGSIDGSTAAQLQDTVAREITGNATRMVVDCAGLEYTSSAGLRALLAGVKECRRQGGDLRLAAVSGGVRRVLDLSGFTGILRIYPDVDAAVSSYAA
ncbi:MAG TPA: STAS domain-containing protein [Casimicrobiaceae bacterium]|jgi:anti-anti-sigma factor